MADKGGGRWDVGRDWIDPPDAPTAPRGPDPATDPSTLPADGTPPQAGWPYPAADPAADLARSPGQPVAPMASGYAYPPPVGYPPRTVAQAADLRAVGAQRPAAPYERDSWPVPADVVDEPAPRAGVIRPSRILLILALLVASAVLAYGLFIDKSRFQVAITIVGLAMLGVTLLFTAAASLRGGVRAAREGSLVRSSAIAIFGGLCLLAAAGSIASGLILVQLYKP